MGNGLGCGWARKDGRLWRAKIALSENGKLPLRVNVSRVTSKKHLRGIDKIHLKKGRDFGNIK
ncbi:hypothetical protein N9414_08924 [Nodularia spumigena CCY9414]|jgi:hypothetical protein|nr:hypothetical protein N9414_08924 [Nodularia spumigena CCY9414]